MGPTHIICWNIHENPVYSCWMGIPYSWMTLRNQKWLFTIPPIINQRSLNLYDINSSRLWCIKTQTERCLNPFPLYNIKPPPETMVKSRGFAHICNDGKPTLKTGNHPCIIIYRCFSHSNLHLQRMFILLPGCVTPHLVPSCPAHDVVAKIGLATEKKKNMEWVIKTKHDYIIYCIFIYDY